MKTFYFYVETRGTINFSVEAETFAEAKKQAEDAAYDAAEFDHEWEFDGRIECEDEAGEKA